VGSAILEPDPVDTGHLGYPVPVVADLGAGGPVVVLQDDVVPFDQNKTARSRVVALKGRDGTELWSWEGPEFKGRQRFGDGRLEAVHDLMPRQAPRAVRLAGGTFVCALVWERDGEPKLRLVLLDGRGQVVQRRDLAKPYRGNCGIVPFWVADLDGDGQDEILFMDGGKLIAVSGSLEQTLWQQPISGVPVSLRPAGKGHPGTVVVRGRDGVGTRVLGLDGRTGRPRWRCGDPGEWSAILATDTAGDWPRLLFASDGMTCRPVLPVTDPGSR
jgi:hypothetical protein